MAESQAERLKKELRFIKESYEAGIISKEEFKKGKTRIEGKLAEWGEGVVEEYDTKKEEQIDEPEEETAEEQSSSEPKKQVSKEKSSSEPKKHRNSEGISSSRNAKHFSESKVSRKQVNLESYEKTEKPKPKKKAAKKQVSKATEKIVEKQDFSEKPKTDVFEGDVNEEFEEKKKFNIWKFAIAALIVFLLILFFRDSGADVIILNDRNCGSCDTTSAENVIENLFPELTRDYLDYDTKQGKELYDDLRIEYLPAYIFTSKVEKTETWKNRENIKNSFEKKDGYYVLLASQTGSEWKP